MFRNYLKIGLRSLWRNKGLSFINIAGLAIGMGCSLLIFLYVSDEWSYDRFHADSGRIYRVVKDFVNDDGSRTPDATTPPALAPAAQREIPEIAHVTRIFPSWGYKFLMANADKKFIEESVLQVDSSFFDVFSFPFLRGDKANAFKEPNTMLISERMAHKYFGNLDPMHKVIRIDKNVNMTITGVLRDLPENSHFHFDFLISIRRLPPNLDNFWGWYNFYTYIKLKPNANIATVVPKIQSLYAKNDRDGKNIFYAQRLTDIHLNSDLKWELEANSDRIYVYVFSMVGLFVILIACMNYINLATAKSSVRAKEIGIRKVTGAIRISLVQQFLFESLATVFFAFILALLFAQLLLPMVNQLTQKHLSLAVLASPALLLIMAGSILLIGLLAGLYPAFYLASFRPVMVLKGFSMSEKNIFNLRKVLVVLQFTISAVLVIGTLIIIQQINYIQHAKLGLKKDQVMIVTGINDMSRSNRESLISDLQKIKSVKSAASANGVLGGLNWTTSMKMKGSQNSQLVNFIGVGYDYLNTMGIEIKAGRSFSAAFPGDTLADGMPQNKERLVGSIILNEKAIRDLGIPEPAIGREVGWGDIHDTALYLRIVGVAKDFHFASFRNEIKPFGFVINNHWQDNITIKLSPFELKKTIGEIETRWSVYSPERPFQYHFLDETFASLYQSEERFNKVFLYLTILAICIACMGLFGLTAFMIERRTKEIGIRKVIGATAMNIFSLLSMDFVKLVFLALVIASPIAWYAMSKWLQHFVYRVDVSWWIFPLAAAMAVLIALGTISVQAIKAALGNPVKSLRAE